MPFHWRWVVRVSGMPKAQAFVPCCLSAAQIVQEHVWTAEALALLVRFSLLRPHSGPSVDELTTYSSEITSGMTLEGGNSGTG